MSNGDERNVLPFGRPTKSNGNGGDGTNARLRAVEHGLIQLAERVSNLKENMATKEDIASLKTLIAERETTMLRWLIGIVAIGAISLSVAMIRLFLP